MKQSKSGFHSEVTHIWFAPSLQTEEEVTYSVVNHTRKTHGKAEEKDEDVIYSTVAQQ